MGKICTKCHVLKSYNEFHADRRRSDNLKSWCKECSRKASLEYYYRDHELSKQKGREQRNIKGQKDYHLRTKYGITLEQYEKMCEEQGNVCAICSKSCSVGSLAVDHCSLGVRALLCFYCNTAIGKLNEDPSLLRKAADYIEEHGQRLSRNK